MFHHIEPDVAFNVVLLSTITIKFRIYSTRF